ncbi:methionine--tRNA ligase [Candidatus Saccharibacteria bacterium]|nr:MAG: methionine--tRNA ligase [Candidatus Saccharibacteria bacterium]
MGKKLYICTAIPYVNGVPHIGHALDYTLADIWTRYQKQNGHEVRYQVGTDEHGNKIAAKAKEAGLEPQVYVDSMYGNFQQLISALGVEYTDFIRTTDGHHKGAVQYVWQQLVKAGLIYKGSYEGWYCQGCENFVTDKEATENNGTCPDHQSPYQRLSEDNYYFKASQFSEQIREAIEKDRMKIVPEFRKREFLELIKDGIKDVSVSRPRKNLAWGVSVPGDESQVMYVWLDALSNYITVLGYPDNESWRDYWPADVQVVGKDILRFHAGIWPAMLMGLDLPLPKVLLVHGHVNVGGTKMSKSLGNGVEPNDVIKNYGTDAFRYYFSRHVPTQDDGDFTWEKFETAYNSELGNDLGNLVQRVAAMLMRYQAGVIGDAPQAEHDMGPYREAMRAFEFNRALDEVWGTVRSLNQYLEHVKPWEIAKNRDKDTEANEHLAEVLAYAASTLIQIADLLTPFMPSTAATIHHMFDTGVVPSDMQPLFPKIYLHTVDPRTTGK